MGTTKACACLGIVLALNIASSTALYTYITDIMMEEVYCKAGYVRGQGDIGRWLGTGDTIHGALEFIYQNVGCLPPNYGKPPQIFTAEEGEIEFIVASTAPDAISYIYGVTKRLKTKSLPKNEKPDQIIVVYTLNYLSEISAAEKEFLTFQAALQKLKIAGDGVGVPVYAMEFRPLSIGIFNLLEIDIPILNTPASEDEMKAGNREIETRQANFQSYPIIDPDAFINLIFNAKIKTIVDVVGRETEVATGKNLLLLAIKRAQVRIMSNAIGVQRDVVVLCINGPSSFNEKGNLSIHPSLAYRVTIILSLVWNREVVNSDNLNRLGYPRALVLDITYKGVRLFDKLLDVIPMFSATGYPALVEDIGVAKGATGRPILFYYVADGHVMKVLPVSSYPAQV